MHVLNVQQCRCLWHSQASIYLWSCCWVSLLLLSCNYVCSVTEGLEVGSGDGSMPADDANGSGAFGSDTSSNVHSFEVRLASCVACQHSMCQLAMTLTADESEWT